MAAMTDALDWPRIADDLNAQGWATVGPLLTPATCQALQALYDLPERFRSRILMQRHGFGQGEYQYFDNPLPDPLPRLRARLYAGLAPIANGWAARLERPGFPDSLDELTAQCQAAGQTRPTSLMLRYGPGDYNRLHQDLYGDLVFSLQAAILLSDPGEFEGGEFVLVEQLAILPCYRDAGLDCLVAAACVAAGLNERPVVALHETVELYEAALVRRGFARQTERYWAHPTGCGDVVKIRIADL